MTGYQRSISRFARAIIVITCVRNVNVSDLRSTMDDMANAAITVSTIRADNYIYSRYTHAIEHCDTLNTDLNKIQINSKNQMQVFLH